MLWHLGFSGQLIFFGSLVFSCSLRSNVARVYAGLFLARDFFSFNFWGLCFVVICF